MQVDPIKPMLKPPGTKHLKLKCDGLLSSFAFKFNLRRYNQGLRPATFKVDWDKSLGSSIKIEPPFGEVGPCDGPDGKGRANRTRSKPKP